MTAAPVYRSCLAHSAHERGGFLKFIPIGPIKLLGESAPAFAPIVQTNVYANG